LLESPRQSPGGTIRATASSGKSPLFAPSIPAKAASRRTDPAVSRLLLRREPAERHGPAEVMTLRDRSRRPRVAGRSRVPAGELLELRVGLVELGPSGVPFGDHLRERGPPLVQHPGVLA